MTQPLRPRPAPITRPQRWSLILLGTLSAAMLEAGCGSETAVEVPGPTAAAPLTRQDVGSPGSDPRATGLLQPGLGTDDEARLLAGAHRFRGSSVGFEALNQRNDHLAAFGAAGVRVISGTALKHGEVSLRLTAWGREGNLLPTSRLEPLLGQCSADDRVDEHGDCLKRVEYAHEGIEEWWENRAHGLEQGFDVAVRPDGTGTLDLILEVTGASVEIAPGGQQLMLAASGGFQARYAEVRAWDADARELEAWLVPQDGGFGIQVEDSGARYPLVIDPVLTGPTWNTESDQANANLGYSVSRAGDVNGDGFQDVIVGAYRYDNGQTDEGRVYVYLGAASGLASFPTWSFESDQANANLGQSVSAAGDVNGDGFDDVIVGAPFYDDGETNEGRAYLFLGSASGLGATAAWTAESNQANSEFGWSVSAAGDVNKDGFDDVIVGAFLYDDGQTNEGRAYAFLGSASGLALSAAWTAASDQANANFGYSVSDAGDVNKDGFDDVVVGAYHFDNGEANEGRAYAFLGSASGLSSVPSWVIESNQTNAEFGHSVSDAGDVNKDGFDDVVIGAPLYDNGQTDEGRAFVFFGSGSGLASSAAWTAESDLAGSNFGHSVSAGGDVDGDGFGDVLIGAPLYDNGQTDEGRAFVFLGSASVPAGTAAWTAESDQANSSFGSSVSNVGDVSGDGVDDVIIGAQLYDSGQTNEGRAFAFYGDACPNDPAKTKPGLCGCGVADTDSDSDGTPNCNDACPNDPNKIAAGACGCGVADTDSDSDGTPDCNDACPSDPNKSAPGTCGCGVSDADTDGDGTFDCNDGCPSDPNKIAAGTCGCGVADTDSDGDGTPNCNDGCPSDPNKSAPGACGCGVSDLDTDGDGTLNCNDGCPNDPNKIAAGTCGCGVADTDSDTDGTPDCNDGCPSDPNKAVPGACGCGVFDTDTDGDGTLNCNDACPNDPNKIAAGACGCGVADTDSDSDGTPNCNDGCPSDPNKSAGGACGCGVSDADSDGDGTLNCNDACPNDPNKVAPGACDCGAPDTDTDGDGQPNCTDSCINDPNKQQPGLCGCGVADTDTDGDATPDCTDGCDTDPAKTTPGTCGCGLSDSDSDADGTLNCNDGCPSDANKTTAGACGCGVADTDADTDGTPDCDDGCPNDPSKVMAGVCGCGVADADADADGAPNCTDGCPSDANKLSPGPCGCGVADTDSDADSTPNCADGCPDDANKVAPGGCGCGSPDTDADTDGTPDCNDACPTDPNKVVMGTCPCGVADTDTDGDATADCDDGCASDPDKTTPGACGCGTADDDSDGDGVLDCDDDCPDAAGSADDGCPDEPPGTGGGSGTGGRSGTGGGSGAGSGSGATGGTSTTGGSTTAGTAGEGGAANEGGASGEAGATAEGGATDGGESGAPATMAGTAGRASRGNVRAQSGCGCRIHGTTGDRTTGPAIALLLAAMVWARKRGRPRGLL